MEPIKFHSIGQFRNAVKDVQWAFRETLPILTMIGTVKIHGTNGSVVVMPDGEQLPQSRNNILTVEEDNLGFAAWHDLNRGIFANFAEYIRREFPFVNGHTIVFYGEWAGKGIQRGVAVSEVPRFFYLFGVKIVRDNDSSLWLNEYPILNGPEIIDSRELWMKHITIDFCNPASSQNDLVEITNEVEKECPIGKHFGVTGVGEGVVWTHILENGECITFKVKGEKHSVTKVKKLAAVDTEKLNSIHSFVEYAVTKNRLEQAFTEVCKGEADRKFLGQFIKWVSFDVNKEEFDTLAANNLTMKDVGSSLSKKAKNWFFEQEAL